MKRVSGAVANPTLFATLYAQSKCWKTSLALCAPPSWRPMAFLDTDAGAALRLKVLTMTEAERQAAGVTEVIPEYCGPWMAEGIEFFYPEPGQYYQDAFEFASKVAYSGEFKLVVTDTLTHLASGIMSEVKNTQYSGVSKPTTRVHIKSGTLETIHPSMSDYGFAQDRVMEYLKMLSGSGAHVLCLSHEKTGEVKETDNKKRIIGGPRTIGNALLETIPSIMDVVLRVESARVGMENKLLLRSRNHNFFCAGDRSGLFKDKELLDPKVFWDKLTGIVQMAESGIKPT